MSTPIFGQTARALADRRQGEQFADADRRAFITALDASPVELGEWETKFVASLLVWSGDFTPAQRNKIDQLRERYRGVGKTVKHRTRPLPAAVKGQCAYLVRGEAGQVRCGQPATVKTPLGLELCAEHDQHRAQAAARLREFRRRQLHP